MRAPCSILALIVSLAWIAPSGGFAAAQNAGDVAVLGATIGPVSAAGYVVDRTGTNVRSIPVSSPFGSLSAATAAPDNQGILISAPRARLPVVFDVLAFPGFAGGVTTLASLPAGRTPVGLDVDQNGDVLVLVFGPTAADSGIFRIAGGQLTSVVTSLANPEAFAVDHDSGHFVVVDTSGNVRTVARNGTVLQTRAFVFAGRIPLALQPDYRAGRMLVAAGDLVHYDVPTGAVTTFLPARLGGHQAIDRNTIDDGYYVAGSMGVHWVDRSSNISTVQQFGLYRADTVVTWGGRKLTPQAKPEPGRPYPIVASFLGEAFQSYQAAASFGARPGIPTARGPIHLQVDPLFSASLSVPAIFQRFAGTLSANGTGQLTVQIPAIAGLRGLRFFIAAITYDASGVRCVSEPLGVTIE